jgi:hypothetical protein
LHTDYHWEETLPNLNPRLSDLEGRRTLEKLAEALAAGLIQLGDDRTWTLAARGAKSEFLGRTLSAALYHYGQYCRSEGLDRGLDNEIIRALKTLGTDGAKERRQHWQNIFQNLLDEIARHERDQRITREDVLDRLVMRLLLRLLNQEAPWVNVPISAPANDRKDGRQVRIVVENANALQYQADVLALKYAQALHGVDKAVGAALASRMPDLAVKLPEVGDFCLVPGTPELNVQQVLFIGVKPLRQFRYGEIREFARRVLTVLARSVPTAQHIAVTVHGPDQGLDEVESFESEIAGLLDCLSAGTVPAELRQISIVEIQPKRAERLKLLLAELLKTGIVAIGPKRRPQPELAGTQIERILGAGYESENKPLAFVAMPFREDMLDHYEYGIQNAVQTMGFLCERADQAHFTGDILQWVKDRIMRSRVVIADLSFANSNVYLEVGYAWGCGKPTILLVRHGEDLKFDVKGQRFLVDRRIKDLEDSLRKELAALRLCLPAVPGSAVALRS